MGRLSEASAMGIEDFLAAVIRWAKTDANIIGLALVGSHASGNARPDSDVDLVLISEMPDALLDATGWVSLFGTPLRSALEDYGALQSLRVFYQEGLEVEFGFCLPQWTNVPLDTGTQEVIRQGMRILYDPDQRFSVAFDAAFRL